MIQTKEFSKVIDFLKKEDPIGNLNIIGAIQNLENIVVYTNEAMTYVLVKEEDYWFYIYVKYEEDLLDLKLNYFDQLDEYGIDASNEMIYKILTKDRKLDWEEPCYLYYIDKDSFEASEHSFESVTLDQAEMINDFYTYKEEGTLELIKDSIKYRPSSLYKKDGQAVAWVLMHRDDSVGIMYVKEDYRKMGIAYKVSMDMIQKTIASGRTPFIHIGLWNDASIRLAKKCGFKLEKTIYWFGINNR